MPSQGEFDRKLNDTKLRALKPRDRAYKLFDGGGLFLLVQPSGSRWWRWRYWHGGREKLLSLGVYPATTLAQARGRRDEGRRQLAAGIDPSQARKAYKVPQADGFEIVARAWHSRQRWSEEHASIVIRRLEMDVFPYLGRRPIGQITPPELLAVIRKIEERAIDAAHRALRICGAVFRYGIATGVASRDTAADLRDALHASPNARHHAAITEPTAIGALLRTIDEYHGTREVQSALKLAPLVFVRPGELRKAEWSEFDLEAGEWAIPAKRMKTREPHLVPLSRQAVKVLRELLPVTGGGRYVFATGDQPMSESAINAALRRLGYHGGDDRSRLPCHGPHRSRRGARRAAGPPGASIGPYRARPPRACIQPHHAPARAAGHDAAVGGLPRRTEERR
jgi:integrase